MKKLFSPRGWLDFAMIILVVSFFCAAVLYPHLAASECEQTPGLTQNIARIFDENTSVAAFFDLPAGENDAQAQAMAYIEKYNAKFVCD